MLNWVKGKRAVDHYKELFRAILTKASIRRPTIRMFRILPTLLGALGAVAEGTESRHYDKLGLKLGEAFTFVPGCSPYWEGFGNPLPSIVKLAQETRARGSIILSLPPDFWGNPTHHQLLMGDPDE